MTIFCAISCNSYSTERHFSSIQILKIEEEEEKKLKRGIAYSLVKKKKKNVHRLYCNLCAIYSQLIQTLL